MKRTIAAGVAAFFLLGAAACDTGDEAEMGAEDEALQQDGMEEPVGDEGQGQQQGSAIAIDSLPDGGAYITDGTGMALYLLEGEPSDSSTCYDACAQEWPPFMALQGSPSAQGQQVQENLIGTITRRDGGQQVTYGGHPLYYYHDDTGSGQTQGQDVTDQWGEWYLVQPNGQPLEGQGGQGAQGGSS